MPEGRMLKPGSRKPEIGRGDARMSTSRWAWLKCNLGQIIVMVDPTVDGDHEIRLVHPIGRFKGLTQNLTGLTEEELLAYRELINWACDKALPIIQERDERARAAYEDGDDSYPRSYRSAPQLVYRKGNEREDWEGVRVGPEGPTPVGEQGVDLTGGLPGMGSEVLERDAGREGSEDNGA